MATPPPAKFDAFRDIFPNRGSMILSKMFGLLGTFGDAPPEVTFLTEEQFIIAATSHLIRPKLRASREEAADLFKYMDGDNDGRLRVMDFVSSVQGSMSPSKQAVVEFTFNALDINSSGFLEEDDMEATFVRLHGAVTDCTTLARVFVAENGGGDGHVSLQQFLDTFWANGSDWLDTHDSEFIDQVSCACLILYRFLVPASEYLSGFIDPFSNESFFPYHSPPRLSPHLSPTSPRHLVP